MSSKSPSARMVLCPVDDAEIEAREERGRDNGRDDVLNGFFMLHQYANLPYCAGFKMQREIESIADMILAAANHEDTKEIIAAADRFCADYLGTMPLCAKTSVDNEYHAFKKRLEAMLPKKGCDYN